MATTDADLTLTDLPTSELTDSTLTFFCVGGAVISDVSSDDVSSLSD